MWSPSPAVLRHRLWVLDTAVHRQRLWAPDVEELTGEMAEFLMLAVGPAVLGVVVGYLTGGRLSEAAGRFRALWLLWLACGVQALHLRAAGVRQVVENRLGVPMLAAVFGIGLAWLLVNLRSWPSPLRWAGTIALIGALCNGIAIAANGRMPYSPAAAAAAGVAPGATTPKNAPATDDSSLVFLGDVIPVPGLHKIVSVGDVLISLGVVLLLAMAMRAKEVTGDAIQDSFPSAAGGVRGGDARDIAVHDRRPVGGQLKEQPSGGGTFGEKNEIDSSSGVIAAVSEHH